MDKLAGVCLGPGPLWHLGLPVIARRDHHERRPHRSGRSLHAPLPVLSLDSLDGCSELDQKPMMLRVALEVVNPFFTRRKVTRSAADVIARLCRHPAQRVEPQSVVAGVPARSDPVGLLEYACRDSSLPQHRSRRESCCAGSADDRLVVVRLRCDGARCGHQSEGSRRHIVQTAPPQP